MFISVLFAIEKKIEKQLKCLATGAVGSIPVHKIF